MEFEIHSFEGDAIQGPRAPIHIPNQPTTRVPSKKRRREEEEKRDPRGEVRQEPPDEEEEVEDGEATPHVDVRVEGVIVVASTLVRPPAGGKIFPPLRWRSFESQCPGSRCKTGFPFAIRERRKTQVGRTRDRKERARILLN